MKGNALLHTVKVFAGLERPHSQTTEKEKDAIRKYACRSEKAVEIGVYEGVNTLNILNSMEEGGVLYAIDPFFRGSLGISYSKLIAEHTVRKNGYSKNIRFIRKFSHEAVQDVPDELDFIFVDGDHSWEGIQRDWNDWAPKVKIGGFILLHDTSVPPHDPNVAGLGSFRFFQAVIKHDQQTELIETIDSLNIMKRIK